VVLSGAISDEKLFESEIRTSGNHFPYFVRLGRTFDYATAKRLAEQALQYANLTALQALAQLQPVATSEVVSTLDGVRIIARATRHGQTGGPQLIILLRHQLRGQYRRIFRELARSTIIRSAIRISGQGLRPEILTQVPFYPGLDEFDLEATLEDTLDKRDLATYADIVGIERVAQRKIGTIILDTSGSMSGSKLLAAATAAAVAAYHLRHDKYALVAFNTLASTIKGMNQPANIDYIVDTILDTEPAGYTNIADGLERGYEQYRRAGRRESWAILITDGIANRGGDPEPHARRFHSLHVLQTPGTYAQGDETCQRLARLGGGRHIKVQDYTTVPRALIHLLYHT